MSLAWASCPQEQATFLLNSFVCPWVSSPAELALVPSALPLGSEPVVAHRGLGCMVAGTRWYQSLPKCLKQKLKHHPEHLPLPSRLTQSNPSPTNSASKFGSVCFSLSLLPLFGPSPHQLFCEQQQQCLTALASCSLFSVLQAE